MCRDWRVVIHSAQVDSVRLQCRRYSNTLLLLPDEKLPFQSLQSFQVKTREGFVFFTQLISNVLNAQVWSLASKYLIGHPPKNCRIVFMKDNFKIPDMLNYPTKTVLQK